VRRGDFRIRSVGRSDYSVFGIIDPWTPRRFLFTWVFSRIYIFKIRIIRLIVAVGIDRTRLVAGCRIALNLKICAARNARFRVGAFTAIVSAGVLIAIPVSPVIVSAISNFGLGVAKAGAA
jgi:hypothetical protein